MVEKTQNSKGLKQESENNIQIKQRKNDSVGAWKPLVFVLYTIVYLVPVLTWYNPT